MDKKWFRPLKMLWVLLALGGCAGLAGFFFFAYVVLPQKVADSVVARSKVRAAINWTPQDEGFSYQNITFATSDGVTLSGWWMPALKPHRPLGTVILSHGIFHNRGQVLNRAVFLVKAGYQILLFDQRGEGLSGSSPISGGRFEALDYLAAVNYLKEHQHLVKPVVFFGFSLGAISAIRAAALYPDVNAVIADSPLPNVKNYVSRRGLGGVFASLPGFFDCCLKNYDRLTGLSLKPSDLDLKPVVEHLNEMPILYITGEKDDLALSSEVRTLFNETQSHHRSLVYIPNAGHEQTYTMYPMIYEQAVKNFLTQVREKFPELSEAELLEKVKKQPAFKMRSVGFPEKVESFFSKAL